VLCLSKTYRERLEDASVPRLRWKSFAIAIAKLGNGDLSSANAKATLELGNRDTISASIATASPTKPATTTTTRSTILSLLTVSSFSLYATTPCRAFPLLLSLHLPYLSLLGPVYIIL